MTGTCKGLTSLTVAQTTIFSVDIDREIKLPRCKYMKGYNSLNQKRRGGGYMGVVMEQKMGMKKVADVQFRTCHVP